jgi:hypothetical protein
VFPILLSVAIVEGILWAGHSVFKISSDPKNAPMDPQSVKQALTKVVQKPKQEEPISVDEPKPQPTVEPFQIDAPVTKREARVKVEKSVDAVKNPNIITVALPEGSSLHDIVANRTDPKNERPPAGAYHALRAVYNAAMEFKLIEYRIRHQRIDQLALNQRNMIAFGTGDYFVAVKRNPSLKDAADLENIRIKDPTYLPRYHLYFEHTNQEPTPVAECTQAIVKHLFIPQPQEEPGFWHAMEIAQIALLKSGDNQTISVICAANQAVFFNSHKNETTLTIGEKATQSYLTEMLGQLPFSYALGQYDITREMGEPPANEPAKQQETDAPVKVEKTDDTVKNPNIITVALPEGSSLHDIAVNRNDPENERPPAGAYHALRYAHWARIGFDLYATRIQEQRIDALSEDQRYMIAFGTNDYFIAVKNEPSLKDAADLDNIRVKDPDYLPRQNLYFEPTNQEPKPIAERTLAIVEHLFIPQEKPEFPKWREIVQIALLKSGNNQTIAVVCADERVVVFNSHKNEITMTVGKEATQVYLTEMLGPHAQMQGGIDPKPFSYALGQYNAKKWRL